MTTSPPDSSGTEADINAGILAACAQEEQNDIGNARRFRHRFGDLAAPYGRDVALSVAHIGWHVFDGMRYREDDDGSAIRRLAHETAIAIRQEPAALDFYDFEARAVEAGRVALDALERMGKPEKTWADDKLKEYRALERSVAMADEALAALKTRRSARHKYANASANSAKIGNMLIEAAPYMATRVDELNRNRLAVNCQSGTVRFVQTEDEESDPEDPRFRWEARLDGHAQIDLITKLAPCEWSPDKPAQAPEWKRFLAVVQPSEQVRGFLKRVCGYCLTGMTTEQILLFHYGAGRNGKSTFMDALCRVMDDYAVTLSIDSFSGESRRGGAEATPDLARLPGARLVAASEPEANVKLKDALIKQLTGGEKIPVRRLHKDFFEVDPHFKIMLSGNHKPRIDDDSDGIWRRVVLVPWDVQIPKEQVDRLLPEKLAKERDGIFAWMIEGALEYLTYGLDMPMEISAASQAYREESDPIGQFIRTACVVSGEPTDTETPFDLFVAYERFARAEGAFAFTQATFAKRFASAARRPYQNPEGSMCQFTKAKTGGNTVYRGIRVRIEWLSSKPEGVS
ncbi:phage/plasmid primase, P4 family [uncultured Hoeflea sp.]|uniref:DNA primase family protein n=1 Tax=uncultured Hoeflea sp. TaxID=538666 RepID=UPI002627C221|nr:phage/plasmid primase, P4 family [uncultured Hoeflea sp.]